MVLADQLVALGYVLLLVDSYATRGIVEAFTTTAFATFLKRRPDAYAALLFMRVPWILLRASPARYGHVWSLA